MADDAQQLFMVFDVESIGLHGEGFAVGYVVTSPAMQCMAGAIYACHPDRANGGPDGRAWVAENCPAVAFEYASPRAVREQFWKDWLFWTERGAVLVADCAWPVEARFLAACVDDDRETREWQGPYPLHELASFMVAAGMDPMATYDRLPDEPQHNPLGDAKQSARLLLKALDILEARRPAEPFSVGGINKGVASDHAAPSTQRDTCGIIRTHSDSPPGVTPPAVHTCAGASACLNYSTSLGREL